MEYFVVRPSRESKCERFVLNKKKGEKKTNHRHSIYLFLWHGSHYAVKIKEIKMISKITEIEAGNIYNPGQNNWDILHTVNLFFCIAKYNEKYR